MLNNVPNYQSLTPQEIVAYLTESVSVPTNRVITVATLVETVGMEAAGLVAGTIKAAGNPIMDSVLLGLSTTGILLGPDRQAMVDMLATAGSWPNAVRDTVKALGVTVMPRWQHLGLASESTIESVEAALAAEELSQKIAHVQNEIIGGSTVAEYVASLQAAIDYLEAQ
jgi:hypothetical protein